MTTITSAIPHETPVLHGIALERATEHVYSSQSTRFQMHLATVDIMATVGMYGSGDAVSPFQVFIAPYPRVHVYRTAKDMATVNDTRVSTVVRCISVLGDLLIWLQ